MSIRRGAESGDHLGCYSSGQSVEDRLNEAANQMNDTHNVTADFFTLNEPGNTDPSRKAPKINQEAATAIATIFFDLTTQSHPPSKNILAEKKDDVFFESDSNQDCNCEMPSMPSSTDFVRDDELNLEVDVKVKIPGELNQENVHIDRSEGITLGMTTSRRLSHFLVTMKALVDAFNGYLPNNLINKVTIKLNNTS